MGDDDDEFDPNAKISPEGTESEVSAADRQVAATIRARLELAEHGRLRADDFTYFNRPATSVEAGDYAFKVAQDTRSPPRL